MSSPPIAETERGFRSKLISGGVWAVAGKSLSAFGSFLTFLIISATLSGEETSDFVYCESAAVIGTIFATAGLHTVIVRVLRSWKHGHCPAGLSAFGLRILGTYLGMFGIVAMVAAMICSSPDAVKLLRVSHYPVTLLSWIFLLGANQIVSEFLRGFENFRDAATMGGQNPGALTLAILLCVLMACRMAGIMSLSLVFWIQILAMTATLIWGLVRLARTVAHQRFSATTTVSASSRQIGFVEIISEGIPNLITQISTLGVTHLEVIILGQYRPGSGIATYSGMKRLVQITEFVADCIGQSQRFHQVMQPATGRFHDIRTQTGHHSGTFAQ